MLALIISKGGGGVISIFVVVVLRNLKLIYEKKIWVEKKFPRNPKLQKGMETSIPWHFFNWHDPQEFNSSHKQEASNGNIASGNSVVHKKKGLIRIATFCINMK